MSALQEVKLVLHGAAVWLAWFLLTAEFSHGRTYGELRRLTPRQFAVQVAPIALVAGAGVHLYLNVPPGFVAFWSSGIALGVAAGGTLVLSTVVLTRAIDVWHTYA